MVAETIRNRLASYFVAGLSSSRSADPSVPFGTRARTRSSAHGRHQRQPTSTAFVARPDPARPVVLVFGPDAGLVSERVNALVKAVGRRPQRSVRAGAARRRGARRQSGAAGRGGADHSAVRRPPRGVGEGRQPQHRAGGRALLALPASECRVVIEAGDLRRNAPLRALCERAKNAAALPCYADSERDLARLIDDEMRAAGLTLAPDARAMLVSAARRRPRRLAQRDPQARALCPRRRRNRRRRRDRGGRPTLRRSRSTIWSMPPLPAARPSLKRSSPRRAPPAARSARSCSPPSARSRSCTNGAPRSKPAPRSRSTPCSRRCISAARPGRGGAQAVERGAACRRHGRACRRGSCLAAHAGARRNDRRARAARRSR